MKVHKREVQITTVCLSFLVFLYFKLLVPGDIDKISSRILPKPGCPREIVHEVFGEPEDTVRTAIYELLPYVLWCDSYSLKKVDAQTPVDLRVIYSNGKVIKSMLHVGGYYAWPTNSESNWYKQQREKVRYSNVFEKVVSINLPELQKDISHCQSKSFIKPDLQSEIELPEFNRNRLSHTSPARMNIFLERNGKVLIGNKEVQKNELKKLISNFRIKSGINGNVYLYPDRNLEFDQLVVEAIFDAFIPCLVFGKYKNAQLMSLCSLYDYEGPPPPEEFINEVEISEDQIWTVDKLIFRFKGQSYSKEQAQKLIGNSYEKAPFKIRIKVEEGTSWQQLLNFYEILPGDIIRTLE